MDGPSTPRAGRRATSADVAARAGVSRATVSYVLNRSSRHSIPEATRNRVLAAAAELGYTPHAAAAALRRGDSGIVLLVLGDVPFSENVDTLVAELTAGVSAMGRSLVLWRASAGQPLSGILAHVAPVLALTMLPLQPEDRAALDVAGVRIVEGEHDAPEALASREHVVGSVQLQHLAAHGHRRIGIVTSTHPLLDMFARGRLGGARQAALDLGLPEPRVVPVADAVPSELDGLRVALREWRSGPEPVTAVCAYNDLYASMVQRAALDLGLRLPEDLSVVGVDDDHYAAFLPVPLTTVRYDFHGYAEHLMERVRAVLDGVPGPRRPSSVLVDVVDRASVTPPPTPA